MIQDLPFHIPDSLRAQVAGRRSHEHHLPPFSLADAPMSLGDFHITDLTRPGMRAVIAFTDATRSSPDHLLVGLLLHELRAAGMHRDDITLLCATGLHRPASDAEIRAKLGVEISETYRVVSHDALDSSGLAHLGGINGIPVVVNHLCTEADILLSVGVVEPHQYAGYSGGAKTVAIGCAGEVTIQATHGPAMLDHPGTRLGSITGNLFQAFVRKAGARAGLDYALNVLLNEEGEMVAAAGGHPDAVHDHLVEIGREIYQIRVERPVHLAIAGVSQAKGINLYQASRAATYLALAEGTPLLPGAPIIVPASIPEGAGEGTGEERFFQVLAGAQSPAALAEELRLTGFPAGAQRAYVVAKMLMEHPVIVAGPEHPDIVRACHMIPVPDMVSALQLGEEMARNHFRIAPPERLDLLVVPNALVTLPRL